jgi:hypothetical protein
MIKCVVWDNLRRKEKFCIKKDIKFQNKSCKLLEYRLCYLDKFLSITSLIRPGSNILL